MRVALPDRSMRLPWLSWRCIVWAIVKVLVWIGLGSAAWSVVAIIVWVLA